MIVGSQRPSLGFDLSALDPEFKEHAQRGIGRYVTELKKYFDQNRENSIAIRSFDHRDCSGPRWLQRLTDYIPAGRQTIKQQLLYPWGLSGGVTGACDLLHFPAHMDVPILCPKRYIITVLDLIPWVMKDIYAADQAAWRYKFARRLEYHAIKNADLVLAISECTARDVERFIGVPREKIVVTPLGVDHNPLSEPDLERDTALRDRFKLDRPFILYVGGIDPRKNYLGLLETHKQVAVALEARGQVAPLLLMVGHIQGHRHFPRLQAAIERLGLGALVRTPGFVPDDELSRLYRLCDCFYFPSLYEGFGFPPLEAMRAGAAVVSSNTSAMPEVLGNAAVMVEPTNISNAAEAIVSVLTQPDLAARLRAEGQRQAAQFSWARTGQATLAAYEKILKQICPKLLQEGSDRQHFDAVI